MGPSKKWLEYNHCRNYDWAKNTKDSDERGLETLYELFAEAQRGLQLRVESGEIDGRILNDVASTCIVYRNTTQQRYLKMCDGYVVVDDTLKLANSHPKQSELCVHPMLKVRLICVPIIEERATSPSDFHADWYEPLSLLTDTMETISFCPMLRATQRNTEDAYRWSAIALHEVLCDNAFPTPMNTITIRVCFPIEDAAIAWTDPTRSVHRPMEVFKKELSTEYRSAIVKVSTENMVVVANEDRQRLEIEKGKQAFVFPIDPLKFQDNDFWGTYNPQYQGDTMVMATTWMLSWTHQGNVREEEWKDAQSPHILFHMSQSCRPLCSRVARRSIPTTVHRIHTEPIDCILRVQSNEPSTATMAQGFGNGHENHIHHAEVRAPCNLGEIPQRTRGHPTFRGTTSPVVQHPTNIAVVRVDRARCIDIG